MSELLEIIENFDNINLIKKKEYKKNWIIQNKDIEINQEITKIIYVYLPRKYPPSKDRKSVV